MTGINQNHFGIETEFAAQINDMFRADIGISYGKWEFTDDATGTYRDSDGSDASYSYALKDLPTGDMPQTSISFGLTAAPVEGASVQLLTGFMIDFIQIGLLRLESFLMEIHRTGKCLGIHHPTELQI